MPPGDHEPVAAIVSGSPELSVIPVFTHCAVAGTTMLTEAAWTGVLKVANEEIKASKATMANRRCFITSPPCVARATLLISLDSSGARIRIINLSAPKNQQAESVQGEAVGMK